MTKVTTLTIHGTAPGQKATVELDGDDPEAVLLTVTRGGLGPEGLGVPRQETVTVRMLTDDLLSLLAALPHPARKP